ncbi:monocarboxylate transporter 9 isoform X1 [Vespa crabro]|uniref:monocarboxylate transporter 9 isoform X1 n=1 Tax=Vespa crabro TaxID=7445 RepID=UPI001F026F5F|nr:monocarboxylate transporter 9 isoform X1 [Vespa crabro]
MIVAKRNGRTPEMTALTTNIVEETEKKDRNLTRIDQVICELDDDIKLEDLAPDGGWGWMVALAMIIVLVTTLGPASSFAIIFGDFLVTTGQTGTAMTLFNSVFMITFSISSLLTNALLKKYSMRPVGIAGAMFFSIPNVALAFVNNVYQMAFIFFLQGIGIGLLITICNTNFNAYFVKKRTRVMSLAQTIIGMGGIAYPICIEKMMSMYGFRGTAALTGAFSLNCIAGMTMMHPVEWHARNPAEVRAEKIREADERKSKGFAISERRSTIHVHQESASTRRCSLRSLKEESSKEVPLLIDTYKTHAKKVASISELEGLRVRSWSLSAREALTRKFSTLSASSLTNLASGVGALTDIRHNRLDKITKVADQKQRDEHEDEQTLSMSNMLSDLLEVSLIKDRSFLNLCFGISFVFTSDFTFSSLLPLMLTNYGYDTSDAALAVMVGATAELISRILLAIFTVFVNVKAKYLFFIAMIAMSFAKAGFLIFENTLMGALVMNAAIGMVRSWLLVPQPLVIIEDISIDKFASAYGIFAVVNGIVSIFLGPFIGFVKDWTDSYRICQYAMLGMNSIFVIPWALQFIFVDLLKWRKERRNKILSSSLN